MAIKYLDSRRIEGLSTDVVETSIVDEDFSTYTTQGEADAVWIPTNTSTDVNLTTDQVEIRTSTSDEGGYIALNGGSNISDSAWVCRFRFKVNTKRPCVIIVSDNTSTSSATPIDGIGLRITDTTNYLDVECPDGQAPTGSTIEHRFTHTPTNQEYYIEIIRLSASSCKVNLYQDAYSTLIESSGTITGISGIASLKYLVFQSRGSNAQDIDIDDIQFYNGVSSLTSKPKQALSLSGCKAYYNFEQTSGSLTNIATTVNGFADGLGSNADGTNNGATTGVTGKVGSYAWSFDGSNDVVNLATNGNSQWKFLHDGSEFSVSWWMKIGAVDPSAYRSIFGTGEGGTDQGISFTFDDSSLDHGLRVRMENGAGGGNQIKIANIIPKDTTNWYHYVVTHSNNGGGSDWEIFRDGVSQGTASTSYTFSSGDPTRDMRIGVHSNHAIWTHFDGMIDDLSIWNRVLTSSEISELYNSGTGIAVNDSSLQVKPETNSIFVETDTAKRYWFDGSEWTAEFAPTRGLWAGGNTSAGGAGLSNVIQYITIASTGNATDFGDRTVTKSSVGGNTTSGTRGLFWGGGEPNVNVIDYVTIATTGNATDFGDYGNTLSQANGVTNLTRGAMGGGIYGGSTSNVIEYVTIATTGNSTDFGDLTQARYSLGSCNDYSDRGVWGGGYTGSARTNVIDYITISSTGNATDFGDLTQARNGVRGTSSTTRGIFMGGSTGSWVNTIDYITIASTGNATDFGDQTGAGTVGGGCTNLTRGVWGGIGSGSTPAQNMDYVTIASTGNASDFGDLLSTMTGSAGTEG